MNGYRIIHNNQKGGTDQSSSTDEWINKMWHSHTMGFVHKKEWSIDRCYIMYKPWKYCNKWKKLDADDYTLYDSIYMKCLAQGNP